ncbi:hypothetical protein Bca101_098399 [Brassica carinata]
MYSMYTLEPLTTIKPLTNKIPKILTLLSLSYPLLSLPSVPPPPSPSSDRFNPLLLRRHHSLPPRLVRELGKLST